MAADQTGDMAHIVVTFSSERADEASAWKNAGMTSLEQVEAELRSEGQTISVEPDTSSASEGSRGFVDALLVNVLSDAITVVLMRIVTDLILRWKLRGSRRAPAAPVSSAPYQVKLRAGDQHIIISSELPEAQMYEQLSLWAPNALMAGSVTVELAD